MDEQSLKDIKAAFPGPFIYDEFGGRIYDAENNTVIDIRGWGRLTGQGGLGLSPERAQKIQNDLGEVVTKILNEQL